MITPEEIYPDEYHAAVTERLEQPGRWADVWPMLDIAGRMLLCLACIGMGIRIATSGGSQGIAVLAAFAVAGVIYGLLSPRG